ncbi:hypothetical protein IJ090_01390 [Candidatus Saccharibacteria bacterium]|nr:hypothetical protein [Candidatus Saccharibacteria bacterium]
MKFYGLLIVEKGRIDVSKYFRPGDKLVFLLDREEEMFEAKLLTDLAAEPEWEKVGEVSTVGSKGTVGIPHWVIQTTQTMLFFEMVEEQAEAFLVAPIYSQSLGRVTSVYLCPVDGVKDSKKPKAKKPTEAKELPVVMDLSKRMLKSAFGDDFDTNIGAPKEVRDPLADLTDDL